MTKKYFSCHNLSKFQHYKKRNPPWIKLHQDILENYEFAELSDSTKHHLCMIWLLAARLENRLPYDVAWISKRINARTKVDLQGLVSAGFLVMEQSASTMLARCKQNANAEERRDRGETETETETEVNFSKGASTKNSRFVKPKINEVEAYCKERKNDVDPQTWFDHYESNGWLVGRNKMKDWKAAVRTWERTNFGPVSKTKPCSNLNTGGTTWKDLPTPSKPLKSIREYFSFVRSHKSYPYTHEWENMMKEIDLGLNKPPQGAIQE